MRHASKSLRIILGFLVGAATILLYGFLDTAFAQQCVPPPGGLVGWWAGDGNTTDLTGRNQPGILKGNATFGPGEVQQAFLLHGAPDWVDLGGATGDFGSGDFTVDLWVTFNNLSGEQVIIEKYVQDNVTNPGWSMSKISDRVFFGFGGSQQVNVQPITAQTWYHVAVTRSGTMFKLYLNGILRDAQVVLTPLLAAPQATLKLGHRGSPQDTPGSLDTRGFYLNGFIDEVEVFNRALSDAEVQAIFAAQSAGKCKFSTAYVTNTGSNSVSVIDTSTNTVKMTIGVGRSPVSEAVSANTPNGVRLYVVNSGSNSVSVIDPSTNTVVATVAVGAVPGQVLVAPNGKKAYVANTNSASVSVIDTGTNQVVATIGVGALPAQMAIGSDGNRLYVTDSGSHSVSVIDTTTNSVVATVPVGAGPFGVVLTP
jgi:YVTN family beta-propeller protein